MAVSILQSLLALLLTGTTIYLVWLAHSPQIRAQADAADAAHGIMIGAVVIAGPALVLSVASWGLWTSKRWGWWTGILANLAVCGTLIYSTVDDNSIDWEEVGIAVCFAVLVILLLLPKVRKFYCPARAVRSVSPVAE
jgi:uncharacterized membrane protein (DUF2068 family)